ncbi:8548_t:CDS:2, partial [Cetraspora pellucida]
SVTENKSSSSEESDNNIISKQYEILAEASSLFTISHSLQMSDVSELLAQREALKDKIYKKDKTDTTNENKTIMRKRDKTNKDITPKRKDKTQEAKINFKSEKKINQILTKLE